ncbi:hypothetical protein SGLAD_v1c07880 [Spiroplasma gladiatoris]|uniref:Lipoprotein n=1 Tax=Spiroplasma gladiatoris TaxID=2143 RepID=A0A4P7AI89_9MOLU|nr:lipoprotein [Spiroplasma gladiatoris]QBQ07987.1 hypothetical protein SGLAD_v1c07880 [Spiroplasma gladiatoris]
MKKLLTLLGSLTLVTSAANAAIACGTYDIKKDGNSVIAKFLKSLNGKAELDASDVLWDLISSSGPSNRETFLIEMLQLMNVSLLANSNTYFGKDGTLKLDESNPVYNKGLADTLIYRWDSLNKAVDQQITREKESYKVKHGKKWEDKWKDMLYEKYTVYQNKKKEMDQDFLEKKYKANILLTDTNNNATKAILDVLLNTDSYGVTWVSVQTVKNKFDKLNDVKNDANKFNAVFDADKKAISQIQNSTKTKTSEWIKYDDSLTADQAKAIISGIEKSKIVCDVPEDIDQWVATSSSTRKGMLSNSQIYFLEKFYQVKAPLAISEITVPFATNGKFDDGISYEDFKGDNNTNAIDLSKLLMSLQTGGNTFWTEAARNSSKLNTGSMKKYDKLLTLKSTDFSDSLKSVVYDYVLGTTVKGGITELKFEDGEYEKNVTSLTTTLSRKVADAGSEKADSENKEANNFYATLSGNTGKLLFIDTDGLHIVSIDGYDKLKNEKTSAKEGLTTLDQLQAYNEFHKLTDNQKIYYMNETDSDKSKDYMNILNSSIKNDYLRYLANSSLISGISDAPVAFDIVGELKTWVSVTSSTDTETYWMTAVFDYFKKITTKTKETNSTEEIEGFIGKLIQFSQDDAPNEEGDKTAKSMKRWVTNKVKVAQSNLYVAPQIAFAEKYKTWVKTIRSNTTTGYPKTVIENSKFGVEKIGQEVAKIWPEDGKIVAKQPEATKNSINNNLFYYTFNKIGGMQ